MTPSSLYNHALIRFPESIGRPCRDHFASGYDRWDLPDRREFRKQRRIANRLARDAR